MKQKLGIRNMFLVIIATIWLFVSVICGILTEAEEEFWIGFGFLTFAALVEVALLLIFAGKGTGVKDLLFSYPIFYIGAVYFAVSGIVSVLQMFVGLKFKWFLIIQLVILAVFIVYLVLSLINKENAENVIEKVKVKNEFIRAASTDLAAAAAICSDRTLKLKLESLAEEFKYSAPAAGEELYEIESKMEMDVRSLGRFVSAGDLGEATALVETLKSDLIRRNAMTKK